MKTKLIFIGWFLLIAINVSTQNVSDLINPEGKKMNVLNKNENKIIIDTFRIGCGSEIVYKSLTIEKDAVLMIYGSTKDWTKIKVKGNLVLKGKIQAVGFDRPKNLESEVIRSSFLSKNGRNVEYKYVYSKGGNGGNSPSTTFNVSQIVPGGLGDKGTFDYGGGGGGGCGMNSGGAAQGNDANGQKGGEIKIANIENGGKGGDGGLTPINGVGGLIYIECKNFIGTGGKIDISGSSGVNGVEGQNTYNACAGSGGGGSPGLPGGCCIIYYGKKYKQSDNIIHGGKKGEMGPRGNSTLQKPGGPGNNGENGNSGVVIIKKF